MPKPKRTEKTKEEIARDMEVGRKRLIITDKFYPALVEATTSVDEAKMLIRSITSLMMEDILQAMKEKKMSEIKFNLLHKLCPDGERQAEIEALLDSLGDENLFVVRELVEGMSNAIEQMILDEMQDRKLDSLSPDWNRMLNH